MSLKICRVTKKMIGRFFAVGLYVLLNSCVGTTTASSNQFNESKILGVWRQVYSNRFVQETEEIGWKCVSANLSHHENDTTRMTVSKHAHMHGNSSNPVAHTFHMTRKSLDKEDNQNKNKTIIIYQSDDLLQSQYILRDYHEQYNYLLWTKNDNASIFVWTRNVVEFKVNYDWEVMEKLVSWNYTGYDKFPLASYTFECMHPRHHEDQNFTRI